jgi:hypothetical protein
MDEPTGPTAFILAGDDPSGTTNALVGRTGPGRLVEMKAIGERGMSTPSEIREVMVHAILEEGSSNIRVHEVSKLVDTIYQALKAHRMIDPSKKKKSKKKSK